MLTASNSMTQPRTPLVLIGAVGCVIVGGRSRSGIRSRVAGGHLSIPLIRHSNRTVQIAASTLAALLLAGGMLALGLVPATLAAGPDKAEVVLDFDMSGSILDDQTTRNQFATALQSIADSVDGQQRALIKGETRVSFIQFASKAMDVPHCTDMPLLGSPSTVTALSNCLRTVAAQYRSGGSAALTAAIGRDTNYVEAMQAAAKHLPPDAVRPTMILFTDGKHDVAGVPATQVAPTRDQLFGNRKPFALLPVGMGLDPKERPTLLAGLENLRTLNEMPACATGKALQWPEVVFQTPAEAGNAVAEALQNATCTFTAGPVAPPSAPPENLVRDIQLEPRDGAAQVSWSPPSTVATDPIVSYRIRCTADSGGDPVEITEPASPEQTAMVTGLTNGTPYHCEVAADTKKAKGEYAPADATVTPSPKPAAPSKPTVEPLNGAVRISAVPGDGAAADALQYQCRPVDSTASPSTVDVETSGDTKATIGGLKNGTAYQCQAIASNASGFGPPSVAASVTPCDGFLECNNLTLPVIAGLVGLIALAVLIGVVFLARNRTGNYVVAVVDTVHSANLGGGSDLGLALIGGPYARQLEGIAAAKGKKADVKIHKLRGDRFRVVDKRGSQEVHSGDAIVVESRNGVRHELVLRAFEGRAASQVTARR
jgi:fibronectin type III domain protein